MKIKRTVALILAVLLAFALAGCAMGGLSKREDDPSGKPTESSNPGGPTGSNPSDPTGGATPSDPTNGATPGAPTGTDPANPTGKPNGKKTPEELKKEYGNALVTDITAGTRTDFDFTEDYEGFSSTKSWILDLNGKTVVVTKPIKVCGQLTVTNGRILVTCQPGFSLATENNAYLNFSGDEIGQLTFSVYDGVGVYAAPDLKMKFTNCTIEVSGGAFMIPDTKSGWSTGDNFSLSRFERTKVEVYGGCFLLNRDKDKKVTFGNTSTSLYVHEEGIGIDNEGTLEIGCFEHAEVKGGAFIFNHDGGYLKQTYANKPVLVFSGTGIANEADLEGIVCFCVTEGNAIYNKGNVNIQADISSEPMALYKDALVVNDAGASLTISRGTLSIITGEGAVCLDNSGYALCSAWYGLGIPYAKNQYGYEFTNKESYKYYLENFKAFLENDSPNSVTNCRGVLNRGGGKFIFKDGGIAINSTGASGTLNTDKCVGFLNTAGAKLYEVPGTIELRGEDAIGLFNSASAEILDDPEIWGLKMYVNAIPDDYGLSGNQRGPACLEAANKKKYWLKDSIGFINEGTIETFPELSFFICGKDCTALLNNGTCGDAGFTASEKSYSLTKIEIEMYGTDNAGFVNGGTLGVVTETKKWPSLTVKMYGQKNTCINNTGKLLAYASDMTFDGASSLGLRNTGECNVEKGMAPRVELVADVKTGDVTIIDNAGTLLTPSIQFNISAAVRGKFMLINRTSGVIETLGISVYGPSDESFWDTVIENEGTLTVKDTITAGYPAFKEADAETKGVLLKNSGTITARTVNIQAQGAGITAFENNGSITATAEFRTVIPEEYAGCSLGVNDGEIASEKIYIEAKGKDTAELTGNGTRKGLNSKSYSDQYRDRTILKYYYINESGSHDEVIWYDPETGEPTGGKMLLYDRDGKFINEQEYVKNNKGKWAWKIVRTS